MRSERYLAESRIEFQQLASSAMKRSRTTERARTTACKSTWALAFLCAVLVGRWIRTLGVNEGDDADSNTSSRINHGSSVGAANILNATLAALFPPQCTAAESATLLQQLPARSCFQGGNCAMSYATQCSDSVWWDEQYVMKVAPKKRRKRAQKSNKASLQQKRVAIFVGCNKGFDAVHALRLLSNDGRYNRTAWSETFNQGVVPRGWCGQQSGSEETMMAAGDQTGPYNNAIVHCIEPMPRTVTELKHVVQELQWGDRFIVSNVAMSNTDDTAFFPNDRFNVGAEATSLGDCISLNGTAPSGCERVTVSRLDTFVSKHLGDANANSMDNAPIDFLSIDTEGYDFEVLQGATSHTLKRTKYLEFEYHHKSQWLTHNLSDAIAMLTTHGFVCYWAGAYGHIWRITNCWHDHFNVHGFSNVACVNLNFATSDATAAAAKTGHSTLALYQRMEDLFRQTLAAGAKINYAKPTSMFSDGGFRYPEYAHMPEKDTWRKAPREYNTSDFTDAPK